MTTDTDAAKSAMDQLSSWLRSEADRHMTSIAWRDPAISEHALNLRKWANEIDSRRAPTPSAQEEAVRVNEWQPIETAPKTGRTLLLGYPNVLGKWRTTRGQWMSETYIAEYWEEPDDVEPGWFETSVEADDIPNCWRIEPTHWMPLPAAPAASAGDQEMES